MILSNICSILKLVNNTHNIASDIIVDSADMYILCCKFFDVQLIIIIIIIILQLRYMQSKTMTPV